MQRCVKEAQAKCVLLREKKLGNQIYSKHFVPLKTRSFVLLYSDYVEFCA